MRVEPRRLKREGRINRLFFLEHEQVIECSSLKPFKHAAAPCSSASTSTETDRCCLSAVTGTMTRFSPAESFIKCPKYQGHAPPPLLRPPPSSPACDQPLICLLIKKADPGRLSDFHSAFGSGDRASEALRL